MKIWHPKSTAASSATLTELVYELLDAHEDTVRLSHDRLGDPRWDAHVDYLRQLQRVGRETLARTRS
ncbi:MAG: hypothetical protein WBP81_10290 [Solirubrobacteraceae bacterium]